jgi:RNA polymerase sigma-70 factor (ECF subfamily)
MSEAASRREESLAAARIAEIFGEHADFVWRSLRRLGVPVADVDDALQEVFLVVHRRLHEYEDRGLMRAWLFSISRQVASHYHRGARRTEERHRGVSVSALPRDPEEAFERREAERFVSEFLEALDEPRRLVFYLSDVEGLTAPEIASALAVNLNTVYGRLRQARSRFEAALAERGAEGSRSS